MSVVSREARKGVSLAAFEIHMQKQDAFICQPLKLSAGNNFQTLPCSALGMASQPGDFVPPSPLITGWENLALLKENGPHGPELLSPSKG